MGYTHHYKQKRNVSAKDWAQITTDLRAIFTYAQHDCGITLANGMGDAGTTPKIDDDHVIFNGLGDDSHDTFIINRRIRTEPDYPGQDKAHYATDFCKTERKPYDAVVTAVLCYLTTVTRREHPASHEPIIGTEAWIVPTTDGDGKDFLVGLDLARKALPQYGNVLDIPMDVLKVDRWCAPWININGGGGGCTRNPNFEVYFCVDGKGYVLRPRTGESYQFESHKALAIFLNNTKNASFFTGGGTSWGRYGREEPNIWDATGSFDETRHNRIRRAQEKVLRKLFPVDPACAHQPPLYVRPGEMPDNAGREFCYSLSDLLNLATL